VPSPQHGKAAGADAIEILLLVLIVGFAARMFGGVLLHALH
jgi:hypothetical protein